MSNCPRACALASQTAGEERETPREREGPGSIDGRREDKALMQRP